MFGWRVIGSLETGIVTVVHLVSSYRASVAVSKNSGSGEEPAENTTPSDDVQTINTNPDTNTSSHSILSTRKHISATRVPILMSRSQS